MDGLLSLPLTLQKWGTKHPTYKHSYLEVVACCDDRLSVVLIRWWSRSSAFPKIHPPDSSAAKLLIIIFCHLFIVSTNQLKAYLSGKWTHLICQHDMSYVKIGPYPICLPTWRGRDYVPIQQPAIRGQLKSLVFAFVGSHVVQRFTVDGLDWSVRTAGWRSSRWWRQTHL